MLLIGYQDGNRPEQVEEEEEEFIMPAACCADLQDLQVLNEARSLRISRGNASLSMTISFGPPTLHLSQVNLATRPTFQGQMRMRPPLRLGQPINSFFCKSCIFDITHSTRAHSYESHTATRSLLQHGVVK